MIDSINSLKPRLLRWRRALPFITSLAILALTLHALSKHFSQHGYHDIRFAFHAFTWLQIILTLGLGLSSYTCLIGFDWIGLKRAKKSLHPVRIALTAFLAHTLGQTVGFAALTGGAVRMRGYGRAGLQVAEIGQVVLISTLGFVLGAWILLGLSFTIQPTSAAGLIHLDDRAIRAAGILILLAYAVMLGLVGVNGRAFAISRLRFWLPDYLTVVTISALSCLELALASAAFYVLLPSSTHIEFFGFVGLWLVAVVMGLVSTIPAGLGIFEWSMLKLLPSVDPSQILAAALVYRVTYYIVPTLIALTMAALTGLRKGVKSLRAFWVAIRPWLPQILAFGVFIIGAILTIDGTLPTPKARQDIAPLPLIETSHLLVSMGGVVLLLIGQGLQRRSHVAWILALAMCLLLPPLALLRGSHYSVSLWAGFSALALWVARHEFYRQGALLDEAWSWRWLIHLGVVVVGTFWLLFFVYSHVEYSSRLWWEFAISANAPRALRAMLILCLGLTLFGLARLLQGARRPLPPASVSELSEIATMLKYSADTQACLAMTGDKMILRDPESSGFIMMQRYGGSLISMGDPIGPEEATVKLIWRFREEADRMGLRPVFYQVCGQHWQHYLDLGLTLVKLGEEAIVRLNEFSLEGGERADVRQAYNRGKRYGLRFRILSADAVEPLLTKLQEISDRWLDLKSGTEKGFSLGSFEPNYLCRFPLAVVDVESTGEIVAFANLWQVPGAGGELSVDLMRHSPNAPKGTMDYLFVALFLWGHEQGFARFSLGMAPLSGLAQHRLAGRWNKFANLVARHGERFYGFSGLRRFKSKFNPSWRPRYLAAPGGVHLASALLDITRLISLDPSRHELRD